MVADSRHNRYRVNVVSILAAGLSALLSGLFLSCGASQQQILTEARGVEVSLMRKLPSGVMSWVHQEGKNLSEGRTDEEGVRKAAWDHITGEDAEGEASDLLTFFVTMEAARMIDVQEVDRKKEQDAIEVAKLKLAELTGVLGEDLDENSDREDGDPCAAPACGPYEAILGDLEKALDASPTWIRISVREPADIGDLKSLQHDAGYVQETMEQMTALTSLRLKTSMERRSKFVSTLSNLMKKVSSTSDAVIANLK